MFFVTQSVANVAFEFGPYQCVLHSLRQITRRVMRLLTGVFLHLDFYKIFLVELIFKYLLNAPVALAKEIIKKYLFNVLLDFIRIVNFAIMCKCEVFQCCR